MCKLQCVEICTLLKIDENLNRAQKNDKVQP